MTKEQLVKALRYCSAVGICDDCWLTTIQKEFGAQFCDDKLKQEAADVIEIQQREINAMRNELCQRCGKYKAAHEGACDGCRWKEEAT